MRLSNKTNSFSYPERSFMLIDTHCHLNIMVKSAFDTPLTLEQCQAAHDIITRAQNAGVTTLLCVGTSLIESNNCLQLAQLYPSVYAAVGIHPNDATEHWREDLRDIKKLLELDTRSPNPKIVGVGECGIDQHYAGYNLQRQRDAFKAQIELALEYNQALIVHTRDAGDQTLACITEYKNNNLRGIIHCFSEGLDFAQEVCKLGFALGIGGTITYPKNHRLREVVQAVGLAPLVLETDAPFLPPQEIRGRTNEPLYVRSIAEYISNLLACSFQDVALATTYNARRILQLNK
jgi:TatD DNase family protein